MAEPLYASLARYEEQKIPTGKYTPVTFPDTSEDDHGMAGEKRDVIFPAASGLGCLELNVIWEPVKLPVGKFQYAFSRDPRGKDDRTGYNHVAPVDGVNCVTRTHWLKVHPHAPLGLWVAQRTGGPLNITHAQLKLVIFPST